MSEEQKIIKAFRREMAFFGAPLDDFTDDEILQGATEATRIFANSGLTAQEAAEALRRLACP